MVGLSYRPSRGSWGAVSGTPAVARHTLEARGGAVDQTAAGTETERWRQLARDASTPEAPGWLRAMGGDVTDAVIVPSTEVLNIGSDLFAGTTITAADEYAGGALPFRSAVIIESPAGTFDRQRYVSGDTGNWLPPPDQGTWPGTHYWPIAAELDPGNADRVIVGAWLVGPPETYAPYGVLLDSHYLSISLGFGGAVAAVLPTGVGPGPFILGFWRGASHVYSLWEDFVPAYSPQQPGVPIYGQGDDITEHHTQAKLARVLNADFDVPANTEWWNGTGWVGDQTAAVPLTDEAGDPIRGDMDVTQIADGSWRAVGHALVDDHVDMYQAPEITGPWERYCRVPAPTMGARVHGGVQIGQFAKFVEHVDAPAEHTLVRLALNTLRTSSGFAGKNIRRYSPLFVAVPWYR